MSQTSFLPPRTLPPAALGQLGQRAQRGGTFLGFVLGLVVGLLVALGVAMYVTRVPTPFSNKNQIRTPAQDAAESQKNREWNPNAALQPKGLGPDAPAPTAAGPSAAVSPQPEAAPVAPAPAASPAPAPAPKEPAPVAEQPAPVPAAAPKPKLATQTTPAVPTSPAASASGQEPFQYWVQVGAYRSVGEADGQKAQMALLGMDAKISEREQGERTMYRVRLGPFADKTSAERAQAKLDTARISHTLLRTQR